jgi:uncharacterized membrane protein
MTTDVSPQQLEANRTITQVIYALHAAALISGVTMLIAAILHYVKRDDVVGTMYDAAVHRRLLHRGCGLRLVHLPRHQRLVAPHRRQTHVRGLRATPGHI